VGNSVKISMIGAGRVGSTTLFQLMLEGGIREMIVVDIDTARAEGEALDLRHGAALSPRTMVRAAGYEATEGSDLVIITAGIPRKPGETRLDLLKRNVDLLKGVLDELLPRNPNAMILQVANPVDVLTYQVLKTSGFPPSRVFGLGTVLDTTRFRSLLAERLGVSADQVVAYMLGEHGDSMVPVLTGANVAGIPLERFPGYSPQMLAEVIEATRFGGAEVIKRKGGTYYSVAPSICAVVRAIRWDLKQVLPVSTLVPGFLGMTDMTLSLPCVVGAGGVERVLEPVLSEEEAAALQASYHTLREAARSVGL